MAFFPLSGLPWQLSKDGDSLAAGYYLKFYLADTTTPVSMATDISGSNLQIKAELNSLGIPASNILDSSTQFIPHLEVDYRTVVYVNEADANANATANAIINIANTSIGVELSSNASKLILRDTTLLAQDDFDRSILFTNGDGFTAGAGPHVLTVTADYNPTNADFRAYIKNSSGIISTIVITSETSTTFTYAATLLTTDIIFVGDDDNRELATNATSTLRQNTYSKAESLAVANNLSDVANAETARTNLSVGEYSESLNISLIGGVVTQGTINITKVGRMVTVSSGDLLVHTSTNQFTTSVVIPSDFRPTGNTGVVMSFSSSNIARVSALTSGALFFESRDYTGSLISTTSKERFFISYNV